MSTNRQWNRRIQRYAASLIDWLDGPLFPHNDDYYDDLSSPHDNHPHYAFTELGWRKAREYALVKLTIQHLLPQLGTYSCAIIERYALPNV
jgi:hypothetical protein